MYISHIYIKKSRNLEDFSIDDLPRPSLQKDALIVLAGPNGSGKSTILDVLSRTLAMSYGFQFNSQRDHQQLHYNVRVNLERAEIEEIVRLLEKKRQAADNLLSTLRSGKHNHQNGPQLIVHYELQKKQADYIQEFIQKHGYYVFSTIPDSPDIHIGPMVSEILTQSPTLMPGFYISADRTYTHNHYSSPRWTRAELPDRHSPLSRRAAAFAWHQSQFQDLHDYIISLEDKLIAELEDLGGQQYENRNNAERISQIEAEMYRARSKNPTSQFVELFNRILAPLQMQIPSDLRKNQTSKILVRSPSNQSPFELNQLSSGEKEAFFLTSFFLRQNVNNSIVAIDEPEMHLHPELAKRLVRELILGKRRNQLWLATHNTEIINAAPYESLYFLEKTGVKVRLKRPVTEEDKVNAFTLLLGKSGYCALDQSVIFLEGNPKSLDKSLFDALVANDPECESIKFIPAGSCESATNLNAFVLEVLGQTFAGVNFGVIRDRDHLSEKEVSYLQTKHGDSVFVLPVHEVENLLIDPEIISDVLKSKDFAKEASPDTVRRDLRRIAESMSGEVLQDMVNFRMNALIMQQSYKIESDLIRNIIKPESCLDFKQAIVAKSQNVLASISRKFNPVEVELLFDDCMKVVNGWLFNADGDESHAWMDFFPGKQIFQRFLKGKHIEQGLRTVFMNRLKENVIERSSRNSIIQTVTWLKKRATSRPSRAMAAGQPDQPSGSPSKNVSA